MKSWRRGALVLLVVLSACALWLRSPMAFSAAQAARSPEWVAQTASQVLLQPGEANHERVAIASSVEEGLRLARENHRLLFLMVVRGEPRTGRL